MNTYAHFYQPDRNPRLTYRDIRGRALSRMNPDAEVWEDEIRRLFGRYTSNNAHRGSSQRWTDDGQRVTQSMLNYAASLEPELVADV